MSENLFDSLMKAYLGQIESSLKVSEIISEHSGEDELSPDSLICGLVYRLMVPMDNNELKASMEKADVIYNDIISYNGSDSGEEEEEIVDNNEIGSIEPRKIKTNNCNCDICSKVRVCLLNFSTYQANDKLAQKFKDSIVESCQVHNLTI